MSRDGDELASDTATPVDTVSQARVRNTFRGKVLENSQARVQVRLPQGWQIAPSNVLHDNAELYAYNAREEIYFLVLGENTDSVNFFSLDDNAKEYRRLLTSSFEGPAQEEATQLTSINDLPAVQYVVRGRLNGTPVVYLHTTVATTDRYYQVVTWTSEDRYNQNRTEMQTLTSSFRKM